MGCRWQRLIVDESGIRPADPDERLKGFLGPKTSSANTISSRGEIVFAFFLRARDLALRDGKKLLHFQHDAVALTIKARTGSRDPRDGRGSRIAT
jgi:hypothetical protein